MEPPLPLQPGPTYQGEWWHAISPPPVSQPHRRLVLALLRRAVAEGRGVPSPGHSDAHYTDSVPSLSDSASAGWALGPPPPLVTHLTAPASGTLSQAASPDSTVSRTHGSSPALCSETFVWSSPVTVHAPGGCSCLPGPEQASSWAQGRPMPLQEWKMIYQLVLAKQFLKIFLLYVGNRYQSHFMLYFIS